MSVLAPEGRLSLSNHETAVLVRSRLWHARLLHQSPSALPMTSRYFDLGRGTADGCAARPLHPAEVQRTQRELVGAIVPGAHSLSTYGKHGKPHLGKALARTTFRDARFFSLPDHGGEGGRFVFANCGSRAETLRPGTPCRVSQPSLVISAPSLHRSTQLLGTRFWQHVAVVSNPVSHDEHADQASCQICKARKV